MTSTVTTFGGSDSLEYGVVQPLTTVWSPPAGCPSIIPERQDAISLSLAGSCFPPNYRQVVENWGYYSPGLCIKGYTVGCTAQQGETRDGMAIKSGETAAWCVPSQYTCTIDGASGSSVVLVTSSSAPDKFVPPMPIRWASSDLALLALATAPITSSRTLSLTSSTATTSATSSSAPSTSSSSPLGPSTQSPDAGTSNNLPTGAIAGIAVGTVVVLTALAIGIVLIMLRRRRGADTIKQNTGGPETGHTPALAGTPKPGLFPHGSSENHKPELDNTYLVTSTSSMAVEADSPDFIMNIPEELPGTPRPNITEMDANQVAVHRVPELPGPPISQRAELPTPTSAMRSPPGPETLLPPGPDSASPSQLQDSGAAIGSSMADQELARLEEKKVQLEQRRQRLLALEQLDAEAAAAIDHRMNQLRGPGR
ncbi:hypothetical protein B0H63DRAFT_477325 [Podospora didyma]|uniref:Uncharacterized protein n=1 Tax=Podospora didyma TaxID=330526 RepID=A0AAE0NBN2_9PEZI|nr:hypothetical protein B0H63DRAFT_477325 [Podospora didyma]